MSSQENSLKFNNRPNQCVWISRSVAVLAIPLFQQNNKLWVPLGKRSESCPTEPGKFGLPAGYLDWDETASEAMIREVWEEIGLDLTKLGKPYEGNLEQPYYVFSDPRGDAAQNVTLRFAFLFNVDELPKLTAAVSEVSEADWFLVLEATNMDLAFNHVEILKDFVGEA